MPLIQLITIIHAPIEIVFDISRSIELHERSMRHTNEKAIGGTVKGLVQQGETVIWRAKHLFKIREMKVIVTQMQPYTFFEDKMLAGNFKSMKHKHYFTTIGNGTEMKDDFMFESPYGLAGKIFNVLFLENYMKNLLRKRNGVIKEYAESGKWKSLFA